MEKMLPTDLLRFVLVRCMAWGFSSSGVERSFAQGAWCKAKRDVPTDLANDEVLANSFPEDQRDELLDLACFYLGYV